MIISRGICIGDLGFRTRDCAVVNSEKVFLCAAASSTIAFFGCLCTERMVASQLSLRDRLGPGNYW